MREISPELQEVAIRELGEDPKRIPDDLAHIKEWLSKQPHINAQQDDQVLLTYLRGCKYSLQRTKEKLDMHYTLKTLIPEVYEKRDPMDPVIQKVLSAGIMLPLPKLASPSGPRYSLVRYELSSKNKLEILDLFKVGTMIQDILTMEDDVLAVAGIVVIQDMGIIPLNSALLIPPSLIRKSMACFQNGYPQRIKGVHLYNVSSTFGKIYNLFKPFINERLQDSIHAHSSIEQLYQNIPKEVLPEEYGGEGGKVEDIAAYWKGKVESYRNWFLEDTKYKTDESKRVGKPKTTDSVFGIDGSFRQLSVD